MNIAFLIGSEGYGGLELNQLKSALELQKLKNKVLILYNENSTIQNDPILKKLKHETIKKHKNHYDFLRAKELSKVLVRHRVEHLVIRSVFDMSIASTTKFIMKKKLKVHYFMEMQMTKNKKAWFRTWRYSYFDSWVCPLDYMVEQVKKKTNFPSDKIYQIPSGVEDSFFVDQIDKDELRIKLGLPKNKVVVGLIGRIDPKKNQLLALRALKFTEETKLYLVLMGQPTPDDKALSYFNDIRNFIYENKLEKNVSVLGHNHNVKEYYQAFDWTLVPSENESVGMVTLESLAVGTPVIGSDCGGTKEILLKTGGVLFKSNSLEDLAEKLKRAANKNLDFNKSKISSFINNNRFSIVAKRLEEHFRQF
jgi:D-inositol-3-phosphate glycosyltransferase